VGLLQVVAAALGSAIKRERLVRDRVAVERAGAEERTRIARELHDTLAQGLAGIVMQLGAARAKLGAAGAAGGAQLDRVEGLARESLAVARRSITVLRPARTRSRRGTRPRPGVRGRGGPCRVPRGRHARRHRGPTPGAAEVEFELLRVAQAALANAAQHAHAARIAVTLDFGAGDAPALRVAVADDGRGFDPAAPRPGRFGLVGMRERAARVGAALTLVTAPGEGTEVVVVWPSESCDAGPCLRFPPRRSGGRRPAWTSRGRPDVSAGSGGGPGHRGGPSACSSPTTTRSCAAASWPCCATRQGLTVVAEAATAPRRSPSTPGTGPTWRWSTSRCPPSTAPASSSRCARATRTRGSSS
jgi:hypothetical protein